MNIIAVDDEHLALAGIENAIKKTMPGCALFCFDMPSKAIAHANENQVDVAFLDIEMGGMNGLQLAKTLRGCSKSPNQDGNESKNEHLHGIMQGTLTIFPKAAGVVKPAESTFNNPSLGQHDKFMEFVALDDFNIDVIAEKCFDSVSEIVALVSRVNQKFPDA